MSLCFKGASENVILPLLSAIVNKATTLEKSGQFQKGQFYVALTILSHWLTELNYDPIHAFQNPYCARSLKLSEIKITGRRFMPDKTGA